MADYLFDVGIIGGGAAGLTVAAGAARFGAKTVLIEKSGKLGGDCLYNGCVPSKTLIRTATVWALSKRAEEFGLPKLSGGPVDIKKVMARVREAIETIEPHDSPERFCSLGMDTRFGEATFVDDHTVKLGKRKISAKNWVISTGSRPSLPPVKGLGETPFETNETIFSISSLPRRLLILGGGPIGLEMAQSFARLGSAVTVVEFLDDILVSEDDEISSFARRTLENDGVTLLTASKATQAYKEGDEVALEIEDTHSGKRARISGDMLLVATGRRPNIEGLGLASAGVEFTKKGITVDARMRTTSKNIFACGDVTGIMPFTHVAGYQGSVALTNIILHLPKKAEYSNIPWCIYTDPEIAGVGLSEKQADKEEVDYRILEERFSENDRAIAENEGDGIIRLVVSPKGKILGCRIVGHSAGELIHEWVAAISGGLKLSTLAGAVHAYPTLSEISKKIAGSYYEEALFGDRTKNVLKLLFGLKGRACKPPVEGE